ncbi:DEAD/DEAH box helicase [Streptomyces sp. NPDC002644]
MSESSEPSLRLGFDASRTRVALRAREGLQQDFSALAARISVGGQRSRLSAEIELDEFLVGLNELGAWPHADVVWDESLAAVVTSVLDDAATAEQRLNAPSEGPVQAPSALGELDELLGPHWTGDLTAFQRRDVSRLLELRHGANFSVPGAGKTRVALALFAAMRERGEVRRMLVVCPKSAYEAWQSEVGDCFKEPLRTEVMTSFPEAGTELVLVNYERLSRHTASLAAWFRAAPAMVVLDEAHRMKLGARGAYGAACLSLGPLAQRRLILTGTPAPNGARDLESLLSFVWPGHGKRVVTEAVNGGDLAYASSVLRPLFTRTTKKELGLPPFEPKIRYVDLPPYHREVYEALKGNPSARPGELDSLGKAMLRMLMAAISPALLAEGETRYEPLDYLVPPLEPSPGDSLYELLKNLPHYEISPKYEEAVKIVAANAAQGRKTLVWTGFVRSLTTLERLLAPYSPASVYGGTEDREEEIRRFRSDPTCQVLISNPATLGEGISLHQICHDAVYVDRDFMAGRYLQSLDRIHRLGLPPGTETRVTVLAARGTLDEVVAMRLEEKLDFMGRILDDPSVQQLGDLQEEEPESAGMDSGDIRALLAHLGEGTA